MTGRFSACIGVGGQGTFIAKRAKNNGADVVAVCDVDRNHAEEAKGSISRKPKSIEDYRKLLERKEIEAVTIGTPDHWHTAIALAALDAGKHVYCEKPMTLTIDEGKQLVAAVKRTGKTFQVGTQQRGDQWQLFGRAVATVRSGQLGKIKKVTVHLPDHHVRPAGRFHRAGSRRTELGFLARAGTRRSTMCPSAAITISAGGTTIPAAC